MRTSNVGEIISIAKGKKHASVHDCRVNGAPRYLQIEDLRGDLNLKYTDESGVEVTHRDVIIAWDGANAGTIGFGLSGRIGSTLARLRINDDGISTEYLGWFLKSRSKSIRERCTGATIPHVSRAFLESIRVPLPPLPIQKQIAAILEKADVAREKRRQANQLTEQFLQSSFLEMFGDPVTNPKGWEGRTLQKVSSEIVDCPHSTPKHSDVITDFPCIRTTELRNGYIDWSSMKYVDTETYQERTRRLVPQEGDIIYGREGSFGDAVRVPKGAKMCLGQRTMLFRPDPNICVSEYLWTAIRSESVYRQALRITTGSTVAHLNVKDVKHFKINIPPLPVQQKFAALVEKVESLRAKQRDSEKEPDNLFNGLMQRAFRGELVG